MEFKINFKDILQNYHLVLKSGIPNVIIGQNGSGKSILLKQIFLNLMALDKRVEFGCFNRAYLSDLNIYQTLNSLLPNFNENKFNSFLREAEITSKLGQSTFGKISSGEFQQIINWYTFQRADYADILLFDEPESNLDTHARISFRAKSRKLSDKKLVIYSSHFESEIDANYHKILLEKM